MQIAAYLIFLLAGLGFGFAAPGALRWIPLLFPLALFLLAAASSGVDGTMLVRLVIALVVTVLGVLGGMALERREDGAERAGYA